MTRCTTCNGACLVLDGELACINCSRPCVAVVPLEDVREDALVEKHRRREVRFTNRAVAMDRKAVAA